jgi:hypothetical protein
LSGLEHFSPRQYQGRTVRELRQRHSQESTTVTVVDIAAELVTWLSRAAVLNVHGDPTVWGQDFSSVFRAAARHNPGLSHMGFYFRPKLRPKAWDVCTVEAVQGVFQQLASLKDSHLTIFAPYSEHELAPPSQVPVEVWHNAWP